MGGPGSKDCLESRWAIRFASPLDGQTSVFGFAFIGIATFYRYTSTALNSAAQSRRFAAVFLGCVSRLCPFVIPVSYLRYFLMVLQERY